MNNRKILAAALFVLLCGKASIAQVPVYQEPHHRVVLENDHLRLLDGRVKFGDTTLSHIHAAESVVIFLSHSTFGIGIDGEKPVITEVKPGDLRYVAYGTKPVTHTVWNQNKGVFHFIVAELRQKESAGDTCRAPSIQGAKLALLQKGVAAYRLEVSAGHQINLPKSCCAYLLINVSGRVSINGPTVNILSETGEFAYFPPQSTVKIKCRNSRGARATIIALQ